MDEIIPLALSIEAGPGTYALLLGSGVSRAAQVPTGWEVVADLCRLVALAQGADPGDDPIAWYRDAHGEDMDYSGLLADLAKGTGDRRALLEPYFEPTEDERAHGVKAPTQAHRAIARLVADGYIKVIVTTNFDRLIETALVEAGIQPQVITSPESAHRAIPLNHAQVTILKLHGDYMSPDLKNTVEELGYYEPAIDSYLDEILDRYGLVVCGWSGEWDEALRTAVGRCSNRRYGTFWCRRRALTGEAAALAAERGAHEIVIIDADDFFDELATKVSLIAEGRIAPPLNTALAVAELKRYLPNPLERIRLDDFMRDETQRTVDAISETNFPLDAANITREIVEERLERYEAQTQRLLSLLATGVNFDDPALHDALWVRSVTMMELRPRGQGGKQVLIELQGYPTVLGVFALGLAGIASGNIGSFFTTVMTEVRYRQSNTKEPLLLRALPPYALGHGASQVIAPVSGGQQRLLTPASDRVHSAMKEPTRQIFTSDEDYDRAFDTLEYLLAVMIRRYSSWGNYLGRFWWRYFSWGHSISPDLPSLEPYRAHLIETGIFTSEDEIDESIAEVNNAALQTPRT
ncbi:MAG TPA: SIR2 family protein [Acidimicrobiales bacterium]|nr:SIR2 family protein [Acidimicrobiales bacterium]